MHCGSQARGFWHTLDLGTPDLAAAVLQGLDYYLVLHATPDASALALTDAYRRHRVLYPDDPRGLHPQLARQLGLVEEAWRILGHPTRRALYDRLRRTQSSSESDVRSAVRTLSCGACGAALASDRYACPACGTAQTVAAPSPTSGSLVKDVPNYYQVLGVHPRIIKLTPEHHTSWTTATRATPNFPPLFRNNTAAAPDANVQILPPTVDDVRIAYLERQKELLFGSDPAAELAIEVAYRVLSDPQRRETYESLRQAAQKQGWSEEWVRALSALDRDVRAEIEGNVQIDGTALLQQGKGLLALNLPQQAVPVLLRASLALPDSSEAQYTYGMALWNSVDLISLTGHQLRQCGAALSAAARLDPRLAPVVEPYIGVCSGLQAYNQGEMLAAAKVFSMMAAEYPTFTPAWRMYAAVALHNTQYEAALDACQRALALEPDNEPVLLLALAACWRGQRLEEACQFAERVAARRGGCVSTTEVLHELGLR
jgi:tetratricopeptide (TPR) repeat protein